jgi:hypothetical protein
MPENAALIAVLIIERPLCLGCITSKSGLTPGQIESYLHNINKAVDVRRAEDRCRACGHFETTYSMSRMD